MLIVDDEPRVLAALEDLLEDEFEVFAAPDPEQALSILTRKEIAVILSDQRMPGLTGDRFLKRARGMSGATRLLITGYTDMNALVRAVNEGHIFAYLAKPWDPLELRLLVRRAAEHYEMEQALRRERDRLETQVEERTRDLSCANARLKQEIADHKKAEAALRDSEERFRQLAENIHEVFYLVSPDLSEMIYVSPAYEAIWGRSRESLYEAPQGWIEDIHPDDRERVLAALEEQTETGNLNEEFRIVRPNGSVRHIHARSFPVRNEQGEIYRVAGIAEDITPQKRAEEILLEAERNRVLIQTAGGAAHEINQPLTIIVGLAQLRQQSLPQDSLLRPDFELIFREGRRIGRIIRKMETAQSYITKPYIGSTRIVDFDTTHEEDNAEGE